MPLALPILVVLSAARAPSPAPPVVVTYEVRARANGVVDVEASTTTAAPGGWSFDGGRGSQAERAAVWNGREWMPAPIEGDVLRAGACTRGPCRIRYGYRLADLAALTRSKDIALAQDGIVIAPPGTYLAVPRGGTDGRFRLRLAADPGLSATSGVLPAPDGDGALAGLEDLPMASYSAFGTFETHRLDMGAQVVEVAFAPATLAVPPQDVLSWVRSSAEDVAGYYGRLPVPRVLVVVLRGGRRAVGYGTTMGHGGAAILIWLGPASRPSDLDGDWVLTHEMVHLGLPNLPRAQMWMEEGLATYVEPVARARRGRLPAEAVWADLVRQTPQGLPGPGGLAAHRGWGPVYWGGALFWLLADVEIRERTNNRRSLDDALRGVQAAGGSIAVSWPVERFLATADASAGVSVLRPLFDRLAYAAGHVDLTALWSRLGVEGGVGPFRDDAPLAEIRRAITTRRVASSER